jgi:hypothetical protein
VSGRLIGPPKDTINAVMLTERNGGIKPVGEILFKKENNKMASIEGTMVATITIITGIGTLMLEVSEIGVMSPSPKI